MLANKTKRMTANKPSRGNVAFSSSIFYSPTFSPFPALPRIEATLIKLLNNKKKAVAPTSMQQPWKPDQGDTCTFPFWASAI